MSVESKEYRIIKREYANPKHPTTFIVEECGQYGWQAIFASQSIFEAKSYLAKYIRIGGEYRDTEIEL